MNTSSDVLIHYIENELNLDDFNPTEQKLIKEYVERKGDLEAHKKEDLEDIMVEHFSQIKCRRCDENIIVDGVEAILDNYGLCGYCNHLLHKDD